MEVTQKLMNEHQLILKYIDLIQNLVRMENRDKRNSFITDHGEKLVDFIQNYADRYHHEKEENILFRILDDPEVLSHCNPVPQMLYEHEQGRECVAGMIQSLGDKDFKLFCENASAYGILLSQHIYKEDNILYPMAEQNLSEDAKRLIVRDYQAAEQRINEPTDLNAFYDQRLGELKSQLLN
jgi:hemerythrin-like domain-containing protein